ncbi:uncharacterized protein [Branchiostoma lanceolatum]|uniref:uncharacterized protein n=1 Tax=Branchiostoma lanceolatum TaxID=7740 RepID=UPI0034546A53
MISPESCLQRRKHGTRTAATDTGEDLLKTLILSAASMKAATIGVLCACALVTLLHLQEVSGRRGRGGGLRFRSSSVRRSTGGSGSTFRARIVPPLLLASSRRRRQSSSLSDQQCQRCTATYIYQDPSTSTFMTGTSTSPGAQEVSICRDGTAACNNGACSINYLWSNNTITDFPDGVGGADPAAGNISVQVESVLICGTLRHAPTLQVTILALVVATVMRVVGGT